MVVQVIKSAYSSPLLDIDLPQGVLELPILHLPHPVAASNLLQVVGPSSWWAPYATLAYPRSPLQGLVCTYYICLLKILEDKMRC